MFDKKVLFDFYDADPQCLKVKTDDRVKILSYADKGWIFVKLLLTLYVRINIKELYNKAQINIYNYIAIKASNYPCLF